MFWRSHWFSLAIAKSSNILTEDTTEYLFLTQILGKTFSLIVTLFLKSEMLNPEIPILLAHDGQIWHPGQLENQSKKLTGKHERM